MSYGSKTTIGSLRFLVTLATRTQAPDTGTGIAETYTNQQLAYADITPISLQTYIAGTQIDIPYTHRITLRWTDELDLFDVVLRTLTRPDGTTRQEVYRVRRMAEVEGRQRFIVIDAELERRTG
jgi:head-tail adaptor